MESGTRYLIAGVGIAALAALALKYNATQFGSTAPAQQIGLSASAVSPPLASSADEMAALSIQAFATPVTLKLESDGYQMAQQLASLNGVDSRATYGARYQTNTYFPCSGGPDYPLTFHSYIESLYDSTPNPQSFLNWLKAHFFGFRTFPISLPNATQASAFGDSLVYTCAIIPDTVLQYVPPSERSSVHLAMVDVPLGRRMLQAWTYRNRYSTAIPGAGNVQIFAGTFTYTIQPLVPGISFDPQGTGSVKMMLNPDNGQWRYLEYKFQDPQVNFQ